MFWLGWRLWFLGGGQCWHLLRRLREFLQYFGGDGCQQHSAAVFLFYLQAVEERLYGSVRSRRTDGSLGAVKEREEYVRLVGNSAGIFFIGGPGLGAHVQSAGTEGQMQRIETGGDHQVGRVLQDIVPGAELGRGRVDVRHQPYRAGKL